MAKQRLRECLALAQLLLQALRHDPLFRNRFCTATTIAEALATAERYGITMTGVEILEARRLLMPELVVAECMKLSRD